MNDSVIKKKERGWGRYFNEVYIKLLFLHDIFFKINERVSYSIKSYLKVDSSETFKVYVVTFRSALNGVEFARISSATL